MFDDVELPVRVQINKQYKQSALMVNQQRISIFGLCAPHVKSYLIYVLQNWTQ